MAPCHGHSWPTALCWQLLAPGRPPQSQGSSRPGGEVCSVVSPHWWPGSVAVVQPSGGVRCGRLLVGQAGAGQEFGGKGLGWLLQWQCNRGAGVPSTQGDGHSARSQGSAKGHGMEGGWAVVRAGWLLMVGGHPVLLVAWVHARWGASAPAHAQGRLSFECPQGPYPLHLKWAHHCIQTPHTWCLWHPEATVPMSSPPAPRTY